MLDLHHTTFVMAYSHDQRIGRILLVLDHVIRPLRQLRQTSVFWLVWK